MPTTQTKVNHDGGLKPAHKLVANCRRLKDVGQVYLKLFVVKASREKRKKYLEPVCEPHTRTSTTRSICDSRPRLNAPYTLDEVSNASCLSTSKN